MIAKYPCSIRVDKLEITGMVTIHVDHLLFVSENGSLTKHHPLETYGAHRQHPKLPMVQLRFSKSDNGKSVSEDVTLVFKDTVSGSPRHDILQQFMASFTATFQKASPLVSVSKTSTPVSSIIHPEIISLPTIPSASSSSSVSPITPPTPTVKSQQIETTQLSTRQQLDERRLLEEDSQLHQAFEISNHVSQYLVGGGYLTADQFWEEHQIELLTHKHQLSGINTDDNFLSIPPTTILTVDSTLPTGKVTYKVNHSEKQLKQILAEQPLISRYYNVLVPVKLSREEFWSRFFQSRYFYQITGRQPPIGADSTIFPDFHPNQLYKLPSASFIQQMVDPTLDLVASEDLSRSGFGSYSGTSGPHIGDSRSNSLTSQRRSILDRFNCHSVRLLDHLNNQTSDQSERFYLTQKDDLFSKRKHSLQNTILLNDLQAPVITPSVLLDFSRADDSRLNDIQGSTDSHKDHFVLRLKSWKPNDMFDTLPKDQSKFLFLLNTKLIQRTLQIKDQVKLKETIEGNDVRDLLACVAGYQTTLKELFQHFWNSNVYQKDKQERLIKAIETTLNEAKHTLTEIAASGKQSSLVNPRALYQPLAEAAKTAIDRYDALKTASERRSTTSSHPPITL